MTTPDKATPALSARQILRIESALERLRVGLITRDQCNAIIANIDPDWGRRA